ncbi:MAG: hypothetical protein AB3X44_07690 [Leptothrix sp. (in: b-proteobacteria)]
MDTGGKADRNNAPEGKPRAGWWQLSYFKSWRTCWQRLLMVRQRTMQHRKCCDTQLVSLTHWKTLMPATTTTTAAS